MAVRMPKFEMKEKKVKPKFANMVFGGLDPNGGRIMFLQDELVPKSKDDGTLEVDTIKREMIADIRVSPAQFKSTMVWMTGHVKKYEDMFGEITLAPTDGSKPTEGTMYV